MPFILPIDLSFLLILLTLFCLCCCCYYSFYSSRCSCWHGYCICFHICYYWQWFQLIEVIVVLFVIIICFWCSGSPPPPPPPPATWSYWAGTPRPPSCPPGGQGWGTRQQQEVTPKKSSAWWLKPPLKCWPYCHSEWQSLSSFFQLIKWTDLSRHTGRPSTGSRPHTSPPRVPEDILHKTRPCAGTRPWGGHTRQQLEQGGSADRLGDPTVLTYLTYWHLSIRASTGAPFASMGMIHWSNYTTVLINTPIIGFTSHPIVEGHWSSGSAPHPAAFLSLVRGSYQETNCLEGRDRVPELEDFILLLLTVYLDQSTPLVAAQTFCCCKVGNSCFFIVAAGGSRCDEGRYTWIWVWLLGLLWLG